MNYELAHALFSLVEDELYWKVKVNNRYPAGAKAGFTDAEGYYRVVYRKKNYAAASIIYCMRFGGDLCLIDHIDGNPRNNTIANLRPANFRQNAHNAARRKDNASGAKGVSWHKGNKKWWAYIAIDGKRKSLGTYADLELAELVAQEARNKFHGEFARHA